MSTLSWLSRRTTDDVGLRFKPSPIDSGLRLFRVVNVSLITDLPLRKAMIDMLHMTCQWVWTCKHRVLWHRAMVWELGPLWIVVLLSLCMWLLIERHVGSG